MSKQCKSIPQVCDIGSITAGWMLMLDVLGVWELVVSFSGFGAALHRAHVIFKPSIKHVK